MSLDTVYANQNPLLRVNRNESDVDVDKSLTPVVMGDIHARIHEGVFHTVSHVALAVANNAFVEAMIRVTSSARATFVRL
jgi:hypothetical protein